MMLGAFKNGIFLGLLLAGVLAASASFAETTGHPAILKKYEDAGGRVDFIGNAYGLDGWMVTNPAGSVQSVYTTQEGALVAGPLFSPDGTLETQKQFEAYKQRISGAQTAAEGAENSASKSEKFYAETEKSAWVALGDDAAPYLYIFINVTCDHCQAFWKDLEGPVKEGKLQVRLVPFGKTPENRDGGAALLSAEDPLAAWQAFVAGDKPALAKDKIKDGAYEKLDANTALAHEKKLPVPPFTLYRRPADGVLTAVAGRPENMLLLLAEFLK